MKYLKKFNESANEMDECANRIISFLKDNGIETWDEMHENEFSRNTVNRIIDGNAKTIDDVKYIKSLIRISLSNIDELQILLNKYVKSEEYDKCILIRDRIKYLSEKKNSNDPRWTNKFGNVESSFKFDSTEKYLDEFRVWGILNIQGDIFHGCMIGSPTNSDTNYEYGDFYSDKSIPKKLYNKSENSLKIPKNESRKGFMVKIENQVSRGNMTIEDMDDFFNWIGSIYEHYCKKYFKYDPSIFEDLPIDDLEELSADLCDKYIGDIKKWNTFYEIFFKEKIDKKDPDLKSFKNRLKNFKIEIKDRSISISN